MVQVQEWLDENYPKSQRNTIYEIFLNEPKLEGELDLSDFTYKRLRVLIPSSVDEAKLKIKNQPKKAEIIKYMNAQKYINWQYPTQEERKKIIELGVFNKKLEGQLDLSDFINLEKLNCSANKLTALNLINCSRLEAANFSSNQLTNLEVNNCSHLNKLDCRNNLLTKLTLPNNPTNLKELDLSDNKFEQDLSFLTGAINLEKLNLGSNWFCKEKINQGIYNKFTGSLDHLKEMKQLREFSIRGTDLNEVNIARLPNSLKKICYSSEVRPNCKLTAIVPQLDVWSWKDLHADFAVSELSSDDGKLWKREWEKAGFNKEQTKEWIQVGLGPKDYQFAHWLKDVKNFTPQEFLANQGKENYQGLRKRCNEFDCCRQCQQPNTSKNWCQSCTDREWKKDLEKLTEQELVEKFIERQKIQWIPYEQFTNIEYLTDGGFSKVYRAKWGRNKSRFNPEGIVALKVLANSQNITLEFLAEIANTKLAGRDVVPCLGISQEPMTKNYIMVMGYMEKGNLRQYLQDKTNRLSFYDKFSKLSDITQELVYIHQQNLVHRDFHSGNVLNTKGDITSHISDLGLAQPANYQKKEGQIFGVLPYVAPEVLQGQPYTQASDIYSWGIIAYELFANAYPYVDSNLDDISLALAVCQGLRPKLDEAKIPQEFKVLIKKCWEADPEKRPSAKELHFSGSLQEEIEKEYNDFSLNAPYRINPVAITTSKPINTKQITQLLQGSKDLELDINNFNLDELNFQENPQEQNQPQAQIQQVYLPKK